MANDPLAQLGTPAVLSTPPSASADPLAALGTPAVAATSAPLSRSDEINQLAFHTPMPKAAPVAPPQDHKEELVRGLSGDRGLTSYRAARDAVMSVENLVKSPAGMYDAAKQAVQGLGDNLKAAILPEPQDINPAHHVMRDAPITPIPGVGAAADAFATEEAAAKPVATAATAKPVTPFNKFRAKIASATASPEAAGEKAAEEVSQPIAKAGIQANAPTVGASLRSGIDITTPLADAKSLYATVDNAARTDFKALYDKLDAAQDAAREAGIGTPEEAKAQLAIKNTQDAIDDAKQVAANSGVKNVDQLLRRADAKFAETQANKDFNKLFFGNNSVVSGNVAHGAPETINIDKAINTLESFDKPNRFGISRLQQTSLGPKGAAALKQALYDAQKAGAAAGQKAMTTRALRNLVFKYVVPGAGATAATVYGLSK